MYCSYLKIFFNNRGEVYENFIFPLLNYIDKKYLKDLLDFLNSVKFDFNKILEKNKNKKLGDILRNSKNIRPTPLEEIDEILSLIMEYYIIILIISDKRDTIIHTGLAHSTKIVKFLEKIFGYKVVETKGLDHIKDYKGDGIPACTLFPNEQKGRFSISESKLKKSIL